LQIAEVALNLAAVAQAQWLRSRCTRVGQAARRLR
jgi:hypothetical protein